MPLSANERLLKWSESAPDSIADPDLVERLAAEISDEDYEDKITGLLSRCYATEIAADRGAKKAWAEAFATLNRGIGDLCLAYLPDTQRSRTVAPWKCTSRPKRPRN